MADDIQLAPQGDVVKIKGQHLSELLIVLAGAFGQDGHAHALADHLNDAFGGAHLHRRFQVGYLDAQRFQKSLGLPSGAAAHLPADKRLLPELADGKALSHILPEAGLIGGDDHQPVIGKLPVDALGRVDLRSGKAHLRGAGGDPVHHIGAVGHLDVELDVRILFPEGLQQPGQIILPGDGGRRHRDGPPHFLGKHLDGLDGVFPHDEDLLGVIVQQLARL